MKIVLDNRDDITAKLLSFGYNYVTLDLLGYNSGSMNKVLSEGKPEYV
jgi:uncharacterized protein